MGDRIVSSLAVGLGTVCLASSATSEWVALLLIIFAGIPHGSFDLRVAEVRWLPTLHRRWLVFLAYVGCGGLMSGVVLAWPLLGLMLFLAISALHFAHGEFEAAPDYSACMFGVAAVLLPICLHAREAQPYLEFFIPKEAFVTAEPALLWVGIITVGCALLLVSMDLARGRNEELLQRIICLFAWLLLPPLSGFAVWFIGRHTFGHLVRCRPLFGQARSFLPLDFVVISLLAFVLIVPLAWRFDLRDIHQLFAASIVLIAGLTFPHMIVTRDLSSAVVEKPQVT